MQCGTWVFCVGYAPLTFSMLPSWCPCACCSMWGGLKQHWTALSRIVCWKQVVISRPSPVLVLRDNL